MQPSRLLDFGVILHFSSVSTAIKAKNVSSLQNVSDLRRPLEWDTMHHALLEAPSAVSHQAPL